MVVLGALVMKNPPEGWLPEGYTPPQAGDSSKATGLVEFAANDLLKVPQFYMVFITFVLSALAGLMVIYCIKLFGIDALTFSQIGSLDPATPNFSETVKWASAAAGTAMALYAILNGLGRIIWGTISDKIGRKTAITLMCALQGIIMLLFFKIGATEGGLILCACIIGFNFGGNFALFPAVTADFFGVKNVGANYGMVFFAYGIAGIAGPQIAGVFKDMAKGATDPSAWLTPFIIAGVGCLIGAVIMFVAKAPTREVVKVNA